MVWPVSPPFRSVFYFPMSLPSFCLLRATEKGSCCQHKRLDGSSIKKRRKWKARQMLQNNPPFLLSIKLPPLPPPPPLPLHTAAASPLPGYNSPGGNPWLSPPSRIGTGQHPRITPGVSPPQTRAPTVGTSPCARIPFPRRAGKREMPSGFTTHAPGLASPEPPPRIFAQTRWEKPKSCSFPQVHSQPR